VGGKDYHEGDWLSLDGNTGNFYSGQLKVSKLALLLSALHISPLPFNFFLSSASFLALYAFCNQYDPLPPQP
jgi:hypothetical protein